MKRISFFLLLFLLSVFVSCERKNSSPTSYKVKKASLVEVQDLSFPNYKLNQEELNFINHLAFDYIKNDPNISDTNKWLFNAYLATGQRDFALLSKEISGDYLGSFAPITLGMIQVFDPKAKIKELQTKDPYSQAISDLVLVQAKERLNGEQSNLHEYPLKNDSSFWHPKDGGIGKEWGSLAPWHLKNASEFRPPAPPKEKEGMQTQANLVKKAMQNLSQKQYDAIYFWANPELADWEKIANQYMVKQNIPLEKKLEVRAALCCAVVDATIAAFDAKYTYLVVRPSMFDPTILPVIEAPDHPSYPSGHSTIASAAAHVLDEYFPENQVRWDSLAEEAGMSRLWAGIHYPMDHQEGKKLGQKVAKKVLSNGTFQNSTHR